MSLTSFLKNGEVKEKFQQEFPKLRFSIQKQLLAPPLTNHYGLVGTAFDYLLRFYLKLLNPNAIIKPWVAEASLSLLAAAQKPELIGSTDNPVARALKKKIEKNPALADPAVYTKAAEIIQHAKKVYGEFIIKRQINEDLIKSALLLAQLDAIYRAGVVDENIGVIDDKDIEDLRNLIFCVDQKKFKANEICLLNPTFGEASKLVGGADADLVIDDMMVDIKTTKNPNLVEDYFHQLIGYYTLYKIGGIDGMPQKHEINRLGIYSSRYGYLHFINVQDVINKKTFPKFLQWFGEKADEIRLNKLLS